MGDSDGYQIEVRGDPQVNLGVEVPLQDMESMTIEEMMAIGSVITASAIVKRDPGGGRGSARDHHLR